MKIAYIGQVAASTENGVMKKIAEQIGNWVKRGHQIDLFLISRDKAIWQGIKNIPTNIQLISHPNHMGLVINSLKLFSSLCRSNYDLVYFRFSKYLPGMHVLLKRFPVILEINTIAREEFKKTATRFIYSYFLITQRYVYKHCSGFIFITNEIKESIETFNKPSIVIGNGIDLSSYPNPKKNFNPQPRLVFIAATTSAWHGLDKVFRMAEMYKEWVFDVIGSGELKNEYRIPENVVMHGFMNRNEYEKILRNADIGIGTLAFHRIGMNEAAPLKTREYLAYGLPTIIAYDDPDLPIPLPEYILKIPNCENNIELAGERIKEFVEKFKNKRVQKDEVLFLDSKVKEGIRVGFFQNIIGK